MMNKWLIEEKNHAGHKVEIYFCTWKNRLKIIVKGPRSGRANRDTNVNRRREIPVKPTLYFFGPRPSKIADKAYNEYEKTKEAIDKAIAEHAKKHGEDYND